MMPEEAITKRDTMQWVATTLQDSIGTMNYAREFGETCANQPFQYFQELEDSLCYWTTTSKNYM